MDDTRLTEFSTKLGVAVAKMEDVYRFVEDYGDFKEEVADVLKEAKGKLDTFMLTLPKKQQAIYAQSIEENKGNPKVTISRLAGRRSR